jgi:hypothetical protein
MNNSEILQKYISQCHSALRESEHVLNHLHKIGIRDKAILESFQIGYSTGNLEEQVSGNTEWSETLSEFGLLKNGKETLTHHVTIPILDEGKEIINIAGYSPFSRVNDKIRFLNSRGIFNHSYIIHCNEVILCADPVETLLLIQHGLSNATFLVENDDGILDLLNRNKIQKAIFTYPDSKDLYYKLTTAGISASRVSIDWDRLKNGSGKKYLEALFTTDSKTEEEHADVVKQIEHGFLFQFPHLNYRVIGNFNEYTLHMKVNIKTFTEDEVFVDMVDLFKNRERQNYIYNIMEKFDFRDMLQLEADMNFIIDVIEKHKERKANEKKQEKIELTEFQKSIGMQFLQNPNLIDEIEKDITDLGYVRERKNKILLYLVMVSRLMDDPLHSVIISRSSAGKSQLVEIIEQLCPPEDLVSISDLSEQAVFYFGENDLEHKFVVIGERVGSESSQYPIRELISKKSITKAVPMKDKVTGEIRTERITVNGPIAYTETSTNGEINQENLTRYFVLGIDETEDQTKLIHEKQRESTTFEGFLKAQELEKIIEKHIYVGRLLRKVNVFNPYAKLLTFPSGKLKTRRDHQKFLRLIMVICFLHQYQRKVKKHAMESGEVIEYIECTTCDYRIAYDLLKDGILDNTLDDIPRQAKELLNLIRKYLSETAKKEVLPAHKLIFTRKDIREYTDWTFVQIRNNFRILKDYEYITLLPEKKATAHQYRLSISYSDENGIKKYILSPEELKEKLKR